MKKLSPGTNINRPGNRSSRPGLKISLKMILTSKLSSPGHPPVTKTSASGSSSKYPLKMQGSTGERVASASIGIGL